MHDGYTSRPAQKRLFVGSALGRSLPTRLPGFSPTFSKFLPSWVLWKILFLGILRANLQRWLSGTLCLSPELVGKWLKFCLFKMRRTVPRQGVNDTSGDDFLETISFFCQHTLWQESEAAAAPSTKEQFLLGSWLRTLGPPRTWLNLHALLWFSGGSCLNQSMNWGLACTCWLNQTLTLGIFWAGSGSWAGAEAVNKCPSAHTFLFLSSLFLALSVLN